MKKLVKLLLCMTLVLALTGCGKEQSATYKLEITQGNSSIVESQTLKAKGDIVYQLDTTNVVDLSGLTEDEKTTIVDFYSNYFGELKEKAPETVTIEYSVDGDIFNATSSMDIKNSDLQELIELGFIVSSAEDSKKMKLISFRQTCEALESTGFKLVE